MWDVRTLKFGDRWVVGDGNKILVLGEYLVWYLSLICSILAPIYYLPPTIFNFFEVWDKSEIRLTIRRVFTPSMMEIRYYLEQIIKGTNFRGCEDFLIWQYESKREYATGSLYRNINFRGGRMCVHPVYLVHCYRT